MKPEGNGAIGSPPADVRAHSNQICVAPDERSCFILVYNVCVELDLLQLFSHSSLKVQVFLWGHSEPDLRTSPGRTICNISNNLEVKTGPTFSIHTQSLLWKPWSFPMDYRRRLGSDLYLSNAPVKSPLIDTQTKYSHKTNWFFILDLRDLWIWNNVKWLLLYVRGGKKILQGINFHGNDNNFWCINKFLKVT